MLRLFRWSHLMSSLALLLPICVLAYAAAAAGVVLSVRRGMSPTWAGVGAALALAVHAWLLAKAMLIGPGGPTIGVAGATSLFAWQTALLAWLLSGIPAARFLGIAVYPAAAAGVLLGALVPSGTAASAAPDWTVQSHILLSLIAYGVLTLGAIQGGALAIQHRRLHDHRPQALSGELPPLESMETLLFRLIAAGFFVLTLAIGSGAFFVENMLAQHLAHKTVLSIVAWALFAVLLAGRWRFGWRGRTAVRWVLAGYVALALAYFGSKLVLESILGRHW